eukprot:1885962-Alexandrium_andersonii.AAC.1
MGSRSIIWESPGVPATHRLVSLGWLRPPPLERRNARMLYALSASGRQRLKQPSIAEHYRNVPNTA